MSDPDPAARASVASMAARSPADPRWSGGPPTGRLELSIDNPNHYPGLDLRRLKRFLRALVEEQAAPTLRRGADLSLAVKLTSDRTVQRLNASYRRKDKATDVLSFPGGSTPEGFHLGDIALSVPTARRQAAELGHSLHRELETLLLHGLLHCLGHDHETDDGSMGRLERRLQRRWLNDER